MAVVAGLHQLEEGQAFRFLVISATPWFCGTVHSYERADLLQGWFNVLLTDILVLL